MPETSEATDVSISISGEGETHRRQVSGCDAPTPQDRQDDGSADSPVAVMKRVDRFELDVRDAGLDDGRDVVAVHECAEIFKEVFHKLGWWWNELGVAWARRIAADPVLIGSDHSPERLVPSSGKQRLVDLDQMAAGEGPRLLSNLYRELKGSNIREHALGGRISTITKLRLPRVFGARG